MFVCMIGEMLQEAAHFMLVHVTGNGGGWPSQRQMLLLKLWATIFQASDRRHPVITPACLTIGACLSLNTVDCPEAVLAGKICSTALVSCLICYNMQLVVFISDVSLVKHSLLSSLADGKLHHLHLCPASI